MRKISLAVRVVACALAVCCAFSATSRAIAADIAVAGIVFQDDEFMNDLANGMKKAADEMGVELLASNSNNDQSREVELINTYVGHGVKGICIAPLDPETSTATLQMAAEQGVKITTVNMQLADVDFLSGGFCSDDFANGEMIGAVAAEWIKKKYDRPIKIGLIHFDHQVPAQSKNRYGGFFKALDDAGVAYSRVADQGAERDDMALVAANDIITANPDIDLFFGANAGGLVGAVQAIEQSGLAGKCYAFGYDANDVITSLLLSDNGILIGVAVQDPFNQGYNSVKLLVDVIRGKAQATGKTEPVPGFILSRDDTAAINEYRTAHNY